MSQAVLIAPLWPAQSWFPTLISMLAHCSILLPTEQDLLTEYTMVNPTCTDSPGAPDPSRLACIRHRLKNQGISSESASLICASWQKDMARSYQSAWRRWVCWCGEREIDPCSAPMENVLQKFSRKARGIAPSIRHLYVPWCDRWLPNRPTPHGLPLPVLIHTPQSQKPPSSGM